MNEQDKKCIKKYGENYLKAKKCVQFNHGKKCETCGKDYILKDIWHKCVILDGKECNIIGGKNGKI